MWEGLQIILKKRWDVATAVLWLRVRDCATRRFEELEMAIDAGAPAIDLFLNAGAPATDLFFRCGSASERSHRSGEARFPAYGLSALITKMFPAYGLSALITKMFPA